jgi:hypothetical protein
MALRRNWGALAMRRLGHVVLSFCLICTQGSVAWAGDLDQLPFPLPPATVKQAFDELGERQRIVINYLACGKETAFWRMMLSNPLTPGEDNGPILIGKTQFLRQINSANPAALSRGRCKQIVILSKDGLKGMFEADPETPFSAEAFNSRIAELSGGACAQTLAATRDVGADKIELSFSVSGTCLRAQVNLMINKLEQRAQVGTDGMPCLPGALLTLATIPIIPREGDLLKVKGDADVGIRDITRVFYLAEGRGILDPATRVHLRDKLMSLHGEAGDETNSLLDCGNTERSDGTPQDLMDERDFLEETTDDMGKAAEFVAKRAAILGLLLFPVASLAGGLLGMLGQGAAAAGAGPGAAAAALGASLPSIVTGLTVVDLRIPETENHRLMIESSRYLKNQVLLEEMKHHPNIGELQEEQNDVRDWLLDYLGLIMREDFSEYNARPYQRYSIKAIMNLSDFATDPKVVRAARNVLEFYVAKFAMTSREGVRVTPHRRRVDAMAKNAVMTEFGGEGADHAIAVMQFLAGLTHRLNESAPSDFPGPAVGDKPFKRMPYGNADNMDFLATTQFVLDDSILHMALFKDRPYFQRMHHAGIEIYTNRTGFTLAAGGIKTEPAASLMIGGVSAGLSEVADDMGGPGTGVPTSLITALSPEVDRLSMTGFKGLVEDFGIEKGRIYDRNSCVFETFACGINFQSPRWIRADGSSCFVLGQTPNEFPAGWSFVNSRECPITSGAPAFFVARFLAPCNAEPGCESGGRFGLMEVVDMPQLTSLSIQQTLPVFNAFKSKVVASNPAIYPGDQQSSANIEKRGTYTMFSDPTRRITFVAGGEKAGVVSTRDGEPIADIKDWPFAQGDVLNSQGDGIVTFRNPATNQLIIWNHSDARNPTREKIGALPPEDDGFDDPK